MRDCPTPLKRFYSTKAAAKRALTRWPVARRDDLHAYRCGCGGFHLGHKLGRRAAPNLDRGNGAAADTKTPPAQTPRAPGQLA